MASAIRTGTYRARARTSNRACPIAIDATSTSPRPGAPARVGATRSSQDHVSDHGRLSTNAPGAGGEADTAHPGGGAPARRDERGHGEQDGDERHDRQDGRGDPDGDGRDDREHRRAAKALSYRELEDAVDHVVAGRRRVGGADSDRAPEQVDEPRHRGVGDQRGEAPGRDHSRRERHGGIHHERGHARPVGREHRGQPPHPSHSEQHQPDHDHREPEAGPGEPQRAGQRHRRPPGGVGRRAAETGRAPRRREVAPSPRGLSGSGRNSPIDGTLVSNIVRLAARIPTITTIQAIAGPSDRVRHLRTLRSIADVGLGIAGPEVRRQPGAPPVLQAEDLVVGDVADLGDRPAPGEQGGGARDEADEGAEGRPRLAETPGEQPDDQLGEGQHDHLERTHRQPAAAGERGDGAHPMAGPQHVVVEIRTADLELLAVTHPGLRRDDDAGTAQVDPPAQLDVVAVEGDRRVEPAERAEQVGPHEQAGRREREHVADGVVLLLVVLARIGDRIDLAEAVEPEPDVLEHGGVVPRHELRSDHAGVRSVQLLDEHPHAVGVERHVVVAEEEEPGVALDQPQDLVGRRPEAGVGAEVAHEGLRQDGT